MLILALWNSAFHAVAVFGLGYDFLSKSPIESYDVRPDVLDMQQTLVDIFLFIL